MLSRVIEDETETAGLISDCLAKVGDTPIVYGDAVSELHLAYNGDRDYIILECIRPGDINGLPIIRRMRRLGDATPVLIHSASGSLKGPSERFAVAPTTAYSNP